MNNISGTIITAVAIVAVVSVVTCVVRKGFRYLK